MMVELKPMLPSATPKSGRPRAFWWGLFALGLVTAIWGYSNIVIRQLEFYMNPSVFLFIRYSVVGVLGLPWVFLGPKISLKRWIQGLLVGMFLASATLSQAIAMKSIPVDNVAFITALYVILTPLFVAMWRRRWPHRIVLGAAVVSLSGVALLVGHLSLTVAVGTLWSLVAAILATFQIIGTSEVSRTMSTIQLAVIQALGAGLSLMAYLLITGALHQHAFHMLTWHMPMAIWWRLAYLAILGTLVAGWLQVWGQRQVTATEAALVFNVEPVWTAIFAWLVLSQWLHWLQLLGAVLILGSLIALSVTSEEARY